MGAAEIERIMAGMGRPHGADRANMAYVYAHVASTKKALSLGPISPLPPVQMSPMWRQRLVRELQPVKPSHRAKCTRCGKASCFFLVEPTGFVKKYCKSHCPKDVEPGTIKMGRQEYRGYLSVLSVHES